MTELYIEDFRTLEEMLDFVQEQIETTLLGKSLPARVDRLN